MVTIDTIEGFVDDLLWYHYDVGNDVLYLQLVSTRGQETFGEETPEGFTLFRTEDDRIAGLTIIDYWKSFGTGEIKDATFQSLQNQVATVAERLKTAA